MSALRPRFVPMATVLVTATVVASSLVSAASAHAVVGPADGDRPYAGRLTIGDEDNSRACSAVLVGADWILTATSCFAEKPGQAVPEGKPKLQGTVRFGKAVAGIAELVPNTGRGVVMARLDRTLEGIKPATFATKAPASQGEELTSAGFGRTKTEWVPGKAHTGTFRTTALGEAGMDILGKDSAAICQGDAGGPLVNAKGEVAGISEKSWQAGCLGSDPAEKRTNATGLRTDNIRTWIQQVQSTATGWKTQAVVQAGTGVYQAMRLPSGTWTSFSSIESQAGGIGGVRTAAIAAAGMGTDTHVVALGGDGRLHHTVRHADGTWGEFRDMTPVVGELSRITQVSTVSIGNDLHVVAVADKRVFHTLRNAAGNWTPFVDVSGVSGPISGVTAAATASVGGNLHITAIAGGKPFHTIRNATGHWTAWGNVQEAAGATGPVSSVTMAGTGDDMQIVVATDNGARQYHAMRKASGHWEPFTDLSGVLGTMTAKSLGGAHVDGEFQLSAVTSDGKILHTIRHADRTWSSTIPISPQGITGTPGAITIAGTL